MVDKLASAYDLIKRVKISPEIQTDFQSFFSAEQIEELDKRILLPLKILTCPETLKPFLGCEFNQFGLSYRSPYSNTYVPELDKACNLSKSLRDIEIRANTVLEEYQMCYYSEGISSAFTKETSDRSYEVCFLIKKQTDEGEWDIAHVIEVVYEGHHKTVFKINTRLLVTINSEGFDFSASQDKQVEEVVQRADDSKIELTYMIKAIENVEAQLRREIVGFMESKIIQVTEQIRNLIPVGMRKRDFETKKAVWGELINKKNVSEEEKLSA
ncbi:unnamed protein product [Blepharisma stoltei]|uniref:F-actin-capping protein subunit beta n=1 Tax=Blepharisma stoltei TaxID=1481888 RepID=A0AAU9K7F4_9CILI|nr:unnamed protein product [Blepharisma stoltei]